VKIETYAVVGAQVNPQVRAVLESFKIEGR
jgi:hypothetical protein